MKQVLLTIGIPTFNGEKYLPQAIESIIDQLNEDNFDDVEIIISDNASTDGTEKLVKRYLDAYPNTVKYHKNIQNIGFDRNVDVLFQKASGEYVEILGDDDYMEANSIKEILKTIRGRGNHSVLLLNVGFLDISTGLEFGEIEFDEDLEFSNKDDFFIWSKWRTAAISSIIIRRLEWMSLCLNSYFGNQWIHISALIEVLAVSDRSYAFSKKMITVRTGNIRWSSNGNQLKLGLVHLKVISKMEHLGYDKNTFNVFRDDRFRNNLRDIIALAPIGFLDRVEIAKMMMQFFNAYISFWIIHIPTLLIFGYPIQILKFGCVGLYTKLKSLLRKNSKYIM